MDQAIEYTNALGLKVISRDTGGWYASRNNKWTGHVGVQGGKPLTYQEIGERAHQHGMTHGGLPMLLPSLKSKFSAPITIKIK